MLPPSVLSCPRQCLPGLAFYQKVPQFSLLSSEVRLTSLVLHSFQSSICFKQIISRGRGCGEVDEYRVIVSEDTE